MSLFLSYGSARCGVASSTISSSMTNGGSVFSRAPFSLAKPAASSSVVSAERPSPPDKFTIAASASSVTEGDSVTITITPDSGYEVASASGLDDVPKSGGTFTISNVKANVNVNVTFQAVTPSPTPDPKPTDDTNKN